MAADHQCLDREDHGGEEADLFPSERRPGDVGQGRIERTLFTLDRLDDPSLRRQASAELNKGESRNALARAVRFHRLGRLRDRTAESRQHRASGLNLVVAAIILWNTVSMNRVIRHLRVKLASLIDEEVDTLILE